MVAVLLCAAGAVFFYISSQNPPVVLPQVPLGSPAFAPQGKLVPDFPKQLILDQKPELSQSYHIQYDAANSQDTAVWTSNQSMMDLYGTYQTYLAQNGWRVVGVVTSTDSMAINADQASTTVAVVILSQGTGSQVTVSYGK